MTPAAPTHHAVAGRKGGRVTGAESPAKRRHLERLRARNLGRRVNKAPARLRRTVLAELLAAVQEPLAGRSRKALAKHLAVSERTVRRWLDGTDWPTQERLEATRAWLRATSPAPLAAASSSAAVSPTTG